MKKDKLKTESEAATGREASVVERIVSFVYWHWNIWLRVSLLCFACMFPGILIIDIFGTRGMLGFTALPLFWGGIIYKSYMRN